MKKTDDKTHTENNEETESCMKAQPSLTAFFAKKPSAQSKTQLANSSFSSMSKSGK